MASRNARTRRVEVVVAELMPDLVAAHADTHARLGHAGDGAKCVRKIVKQARQLAERNYRPNAAMSFEEFLTRVLHQAVRGGLGRPLR